MAAGNARYWRRSGLWKNENSPQFWVACGLAKNANDSDASGGVTTQNSTQSVTVLEQRADLISLWPRIPSPGRDRIVEMARLLVPDEGLGKRAAVVLEFRRR